MRNNWTCKLHASLCLCLYSWGHFSDAQVGSDQCCWQLWLFATTVSFLKCNKTMFFLHSRLNTQVTLCSVEGGGVGSSEFSSFLISAELERYLFLSLSEHHPISFCYAWMTQYEGSYFVENRRKLETWKPPLSFWRREECEPTALPWSRASRPFVLLGMDPCREEGVYRL